MENKYPTLQERTEMKIETFNRAKDLMDIIAENEKLLKKIQSKSRPNDPEYQELRNLAYEAISAINNRCEREFSEL